MVNLSPNPLGYNAEFIILSSHYQMLYRNPMFSSFKTGELQEPERFAWTWFKPTGVHEPLAVRSHSIKGFHETDGTRHIPRCWMRLTGSDTIPQIWMVPALTAPGSAAAALRGQRASLSLYIRATLTLPSAESRALAPETQNGSFC